ncbi:MAG: rod shape-determining protein MreD [Paracoccaceae bacterium]
MSELSPLQLWTRRLGFVALALFIVFLHLLPLQTAPQSWAGPDWLMAFAFAWAVRRPDYMPAAMLALVFLMADLLLQRPPGLWALLMLVACESLKSQSRQLRAATFPTEAFSVAGLIIAVSIGYRLVLVVFLVDLPPLSLEIMQMIMTLAFYPLAALVTHSLMGVRKIVPGDYVSRGRRL